jgi:hypothetical protein
MRKIFFVYVEDEDYGEFQVAFDQDLTPIGAWADNDANWRNEYFSPFMRRLGFDTIVRHDDAIVKMALDYARTRW